MFLYIFYLSMGACPRDPPNMIAYTLGRPILRPWLHLSSQSYLIYLYTPMLSSCLIKCF